MSTAIQLAGKTKISLLILVNMKWILVTDLTSNIIADPIYVQCDKDENIFSCSIIFLVIDRQSE